MIVTEQLTINDKPFTKNYSDSGYYIERDGVRYSEAIDPADIPREYIETDEPISPTEEPDETKLKSDAYDYLTGRSATDD